jgi:hypothetical protein
MPNLTINVPNIIGQAARGRLCRLRPPKGCPGLGFRLELVRITLKWLKFSKARKGFLKLGHVVFCIFGTP